MVANINRKYLAIDGFGDPFCFLRFYDDVRVLLRPNDGPALSRFCINDLKPVSPTMSLVVHINLKHVALIFKQKLLNMINIRFQLFQKPLVSFFDYVM